MIGARSIAREVLGRVERDRAYANLALAAALDRHPELAAAERALATELVYGVLRKRRLLDHALSQHLKQPRRKVDHHVLDALRVACYQILFLERVPAHAAIDEAVGAVVRMRGAKVGGFANAVLRKLRRADLHANLPADPLERSAIERSMPVDLMRYLGEEMGLSEADALATSFLERAPLSIRVNRVQASPADVRRALGREGGRLVEGRWVSGAFRLAGLPQPFRARSYLGGLWTAQDEGAQLAALMLDARAGQQILDACAGVGGKSTQIAELLLGQAGGSTAACGLLSVDSSSRKLELLQEHCRRLGLQCTAQCADLTEAGALGGKTFDRILLDAPCSGLGVLRRHPELKWRWRATQIDELVALQRRLLANLVHTLRPGGILVYAVCTVSAAEGPEQLRWLLESFPQLCLLPAPTAVSALLQQDGTVRTWPHRHDIDGFFIARLQRKGNAT